MECKALDFRCQCKQQKLQSICAVLTFDPQLKKILAFSVKDRYQLNYFICIYIKADHFPFMMPTAANKTRKQILF
jgi:hypothetical protein